MASPLGISEQPLQQWSQKLPWFSKKDILGTPAQVNQKMVWWQYEKCEEIKLSVGRKFYPLEEKQKCLEDEMKKKRPDEFNKCHCCREI